MRANSHVRRIATLVVLVIIWFALNATVIPAANSTHQTTRYPLLADFDLSLKSLTAPAWHGLPSFGIPLANGDPLGHPDIAKVVVTLRLTKGEKLVHSKFTVCCNPFHPAGPRLKAATQRYKPMPPLPDGWRAFQWTYAHLKYGIGATWFVWVAPAPGTHQVCLAVTAKPTSGPTQLIHPYCQSA